MGLLLGMSLFSMFFFVSLYMQQVLGYEPLKAGLAYLPLAQHDHRVRRRGVGARHAHRLQADADPEGMLFIAGGLVWFAQVSAPGGSYVGDILFVAAGGNRPRTGVRPDDDRGRDRRQAGRGGLASGLINTSQQVGGALGLAVLAAVATATTNDAIAAGEGNRLVSLTEGFQDAFLVGAGMALLGALLAAVLISSRDSREHAEAAGPARARPRRSQPEFGWERRGPSAPALPLRARA